MKILTDWITDLAVTMGKLGLFTSSSTPEKTTPVNLDRILMEDSAASWAKKWAAVGNLPSEAAVLAVRWKAPVRFKSTSGNIDVTSAPKWVDSFNPMVDGDRILLDQQTTVTEDGIWIFNGKGNAMTRASDAQVGAEFAGVAVIITEGTLSKHCELCDNVTGYDVIGTDGLTFGELNAIPRSHQLAGARHTSDFLAQLNSKLDQTLLARQNINIQYMHKVTAGEVTAGYLTLPSNPVAPGSPVEVTIAGGFQQVSKQVVGATGLTPDFDILSTNQLHINNNGAATGLSGDIVQDDVLIITYPRDA